MEREPRRWNGAEAWIFLSIGDACGTGQTTLDKVIGAADSNKHSIPNVDEFSLAVGQLVGAGLVVAAPNRYALTDSGRGLFKEINSLRRGHIESFVEIAEASTNRRGMTDWIGWMTTSKSYNNKESNSATETVWTGSHRIPERSRDCHHSRVRRSDRTRL
jgi:hypothetical protein